MYQKLIFRWLIENDMVYITFLLWRVTHIGSHQKAGALNGNKHQFK
jgi:hypothetical protein